MLEPSPGIRGAEVSNPIYVVVVTGLIGTIATLILSMARGREQPPRRVPWIIALVALGLDSAVHVAISIGSLAMGGWESAWIAIGSLAIAGVFATAWIRPRIAGWWLITTAFALPILLFVSSAVWPTSEETVPVGVLLAFYTPRMLIVGGLLIWAAWPIPQQTTSEQRAESPAASGYPRP
jgi:hypothetical protein